MADPTPDQKILFDGIGLLNDAKFLEKLAGGPTSDSWLVMAGEERFVARLDRPLAGLLELDRHAELEVLQTVSAAGIGPQIIWADPGKGLLLTTYIPGEAWSPRDMHDPARLTALARILNRLHSLPPCGPVFTRGETALACATQSGTQEATRIAEQTTTLAEKLSSETRRPALCHNDLVYSNIIGGEPIRLIDWEYAAVGDPYFDLAVVVRHHQLKADLIENFLGSYFGAPGKEHFSRLEAFCRLYDQLAALWYLSVVNQAGHEAVYDEELKRAMARLQEPLTL